VLTPSTTKPKNPQRVETIALDAFKPGATFENAVDLYVFDKRLRMLVMDALERIEVALRVEVSHTLGELDPFAHYKPQWFDETFGTRINPRTGTTAHHRWLDKHARLVTRSRETFVEHNKSKYGLPLAIWIACEVWDFGALSHLFGGMRMAEQDAIAKRYGINDGRIFASWLRSLNYLRNVCAHHCRLWNRNIIDQPRLPPTDEIPWISSFEAERHPQSRCFLLLWICRHMLEMVNPHSSWPERMKKHLLTFPDLERLDLSLAGMGAPERWQELR
jgi:abortive infection bacteriophage resistance protein